MDLNCIFAAPLCSYWLMYFTLCDIYICVCCLLVFICYCEFLLLSVVVLCLIYMIGLFACGYGGFVTRSVLRDLCLFD